MGIDACIDFFSGCLQKRERNKGGLAGLGCSNLPRHGERGEVRLPTRASKRAALVLHKNVVDSPHKTVFSCPTIQVVRLVQALQVRHHNKGVQCNMIIQYRTVPGRVRKKNK